MLGPYAIAYLFLGGLGAGAIGVASLFDLLLVRQPFGAAGRAGLSDATSSERVAGGTFVVGLLALAAGMACLVHDLGRVDRVLDLFLNPSLSYLTMGAYALVALSAVAFFLVAVRILYVADVARRVVVVCEWAAVVLAVAVATYTGLLLQGIVGIAFWHSACVPLLFVLSSASCGLAVVLAACVVAPHDASTYGIVRLSIRADAMMLALEAVVVGIFVVTSQFSAHPAVLQSAAALFEGGLAPLWWLGFVGCGIVVPIVCEAVFAGTRRGHAAVVLMAAVAVLVGGASLRIGVVEAGVQRALELQGVPATQQAVGMASLLTTDDAGARQSMLTEES